MSSDLERIGRSNGIYFTGRELMSARFPEPKWAVPGLVAEGLNLLVGAPKFGKSWLCLNLAYAITSGTKALGQIDVEQGAVLYAALEDNPRRLQNRLRIVLDGQPVPNDLHIVTSLPRLPELKALLDGWLEVTPTARLVIVDVLRKVRAISDGRGNAYSEDYEALGALKALADKYGVAFIAVHHTRKMADDSDVFNEVSGSTGLTGAADAILVAKRARNTAEGVLHITGRDVTEREYGLLWDAGICTWSLSEEPVFLSALGDTRRQILDWLAKNPAATPTEITHGTGLNLDTVKSNVRRMVSDGQLETDGQGRYYPSATATGATRATQPGAELHELRGLQLQDDLGESA